MEVYDIGIVIPAIIPPTILTNIVFPMIKVLKFLWVMEDVGIGLLRPANITLAIAEFIIVMTMVEADLGLKRLDKFSLAIMYFIILVLMVELELGIKIPATIPLTIVDHNFMLEVEVNIGLRPATITPITHVDVVDVVVVVYWKSVREV